jgi:hypothetical protein
MAKSACFSMHTTHKLADSSLSITARAAVSAAYASWMSIFKPAKSGLSVAFSFQHCFMVLNIISGQFSGRFGRSPFKILQHITSDSHWTELWHGKCSYHLLAHSF